MATTRIGIFGGTFDPLHLGHINSIETVLREMRLDRLKVIPTNVSPGRPATEGPTPKQRLEMVRRGLADLAPKVEVDDIELKRPGVSYTIDTLLALLKTNKKAQLFLVIGADQFENFDKWKKYDQILEKVHLVVTSRPGSGLPHALDDFPAVVRPKIKAYKGGVATLASGKQIYFVQLADIPVSATEVRRRFRAKESVKDLISPAVETYIRGQGLYESLGARIGDFEKFTRFCYQVLKDKSGINVQAYDLRSLTQPSEFTVVASGTSTRHTQALGEALMKAVKDNYGIWPASVEGLKEGRWVLLDYGSLIVHAFYDFVRSEYRLEELWKEAEEMKIAEDVQIEGPRLRKAPH